MHIYSGMHAAYSCWRVYLYVFKYAQHCALYKLVYIAVSVRLSAIERAASHVSRIFVCQMLALLEFRCVYSVLYCWHMRTLNRTYHHTRD